MTTQRDQEHVKDRAARVADVLVGTPRPELPTPLLVLDYPALERNIETMAMWSRTHADVRPHAKVHKSPQIAQLQIAAGAVGITTATVWEALAMVDAGIQNILIANQLADRARATYVAQAARETQILVSVDSGTGIELLDNAASQASSRIGVLIEVDTGMSRGGVRTADEALQLTSTLDSCSALAFRGVMAWEGHTVTETNDEVRMDNAFKSTEKLLEVAEALRSRGFPVSIVSAGGTNTFRFTGAVTGVTEVQAGTYAVMDTSYETLSPPFEPVLSVTGTVVSHHGGRVVLDCGTKIQATTDLAPPRLRLHDGTVAELHEEHALLDINCAANLKIGDKFEMFVSYASGTVNLHDFYVVCDEQSVLDVWPIMARRPSADEICSLRRAG